MDVRCCSAVTGAEVTVQLPTTATIFDLRQSLFGHVNDPKILKENQIRILLNDEPVAGIETVNGEHIYEYVVVSPDLHDALECIRLTTMPDGDANTDWHDIANLLEDRFVEHAQLKDQQIILDFTAAQRVQQRAQEIAEAPGTRDSLDTASFIIKAIKEAAESLRSFLVNNPQLRGIELLDAIREEYSDLLQ
ncbi:unnamed protein product [Cladocopium goreaui]|uniref:Uncharacterized protein n=1 Tax=Cladocopium goreaui TaxID=2562237 RepID=A0A9P1GTM5_9DINO|nr:unnamed protein product [Cladocopium goreaui]